MNNPKNDKKLEQIAKKYDLELLLLFGSRVKGKALHKESDFDVAYLSKRNLDLTDEAKLICDLMPVFKSDKVETANIKIASPLLMKQIFSDHIILFCKDISIYFRYKIYSERKYAEAKPLFELTRYSINKFLKNHGQ